MDYWQSIFHLDYTLFDLVNQGWSNAFFDAVFPFVRQPNLWAPFYLFLILFITINFKGQGWWWVLLFVLTVSFSDIISSHLIKEFIGRLRPCRDPVFSQHINFLAGYCPKSGSFTSSHAANHFALATFIAGTLGKLSKQWRWIYLWAFAISYAQVYVGVHYPIDILGGALVGLLVGNLSARFFNKKIGLPFLINPEQA